MRSNRETLKLVIALAAILAGVGAMLAGRPIASPEGILAPDDPLQRTLQAAEPFEFAGYRLRPRAEFELQARVLSAESYRWDGGAQLAPLDLALGWGPMSDSAMISRFEVTQGARFYTLYPRDDSADLALALRHSANMHLIPADDAVRRVLGSARAGHLVSLRGRLVDASGPNGFAWRTSLSRDDTGDGACELFLVESAEIL